MKCGNFHSWNGQLSASYMEQKAQVTMTYVAGIILSWTIIVKVAGKERDFIRVLFFLSQYFEEVEKDLTYLRFWKEFFWKVSFLGWDFFKISSSIWRARSNTWILKRNRHWSTEQYHFSLVGIVYSTLILIPALIARTCKVQNWM